MRTLDEIRNNPAIMKYLRFGVELDDILRPTGDKTEEELKKQAGFFFCIGGYNGRSRLLLVHMLPDGWADLDIIVSGVPETMLAEAVREYNGKSHGEFYPINKPIEDMLRSALGVAGERSGQDKEQETGPGGGEHENRFCAGCGAAVEAGKECIVCGELKKEE